MIIRFRMPFKNDTGGVDASADFETDELKIDGVSYDLDHIRHTLRLPYDIRKPKSGWRDRKSFTPEEKVKLRPIAETLAMLDGNAFFTIGFEDDHYEQYLPEAHALYESNGGDAGWAGLASFAKKALKEQENQ